VDTKRNRIRVEHGNCQQVDRETQRRDASDHCQNISAMKIEYMPSFAVKIPDVTRLRGCGR